MTAEIIQFIPKPNPNREKRELEKEAAAPRASAAYDTGSTIGIPFGGQGIDGMTFEKEPA